VKFLKLFLCLGAIVELPKVCNRIRYLEDSDCKLKLRLERLETPPTGGE